MNTEDKIGALLVTVLVLAGLVCGVLFMQVTGTWHEQKMQALDKAQKARIAPMMTVTKEVEARTYDSAIMLVTPTFIFTFNTLDLDQLQKQFIDRQTLETQVLARAIDLATYKTIAYYRVAELQPGSLQVEEIRKRLTKEVEELTKEVRAEVTLRSIDFSLPMVKKNELRK